MYEAWFQNWLSQVCKQHADRVQPIILTGRKKEKKTICCSFIYFIFHCHFHLLGKQDGCPGLGRFYQQGNPEIKFYHEQPNWNTTSLRRQKCILVIRREASAGGKKESVGSHDVSVCSILPQVSQILGAACGDENTDNHTQRRERLELKHANTARYKETSSGAVCYQTCWRDDA